jgi:hypothetical protein
VALFATPLGGLADLVRQRDARVAAIVDRVRAHPPQSVVLLTGPEGTATYRLAEYYLPVYKTVALGRDRARRAGELFSTEGGAPEYDLNRFERAGPLRLPPGRDALVLDQDVMAVIVDREQLTIDNPSAPRSQRIFRVGLDPSDPPVAWREWIYLRASDCRPCGHMADAPATRTRRLN